MTGADVVRTARGWLGVPFAHQGRTRRGCDCIGLVASVAIEAGLLDADWWQREFDPVFSGYGRSPTGDMLRAGCFRWMVEHDEARPGDVALLRFRGEPQHLAIVSDYVHGGLAIIHALSTAGAVVEHRYAQLWRDRTLGVFAIPGVAWPN